MFEDAGDIGNMDPNEIQDLPGSSAAHDSVMRQQGMSGMGIPADAAAGSTKSDPALLRAIAQSAGSLTDVARGVGQAGQVQAAAQLQALRKQGQISEASFQAQMKQLQQQLGRRTLMGRWGWLLVVGGIAVIGGIWYFTRRRRRRAANRGC